MTTSPERFAQLLTEGIHRIRIEERKSIRVIQDDLGYGLGREGGSVIEHWRKGRLPPHLSDVEQLARAIVTRGLLDQLWLDAFLRSAGHPAPALLVGELFPKRATDGDLEKAEKKSTSTILPISPPPHNLPISPTPLVGRKAEIAVVTEMLRQADTWLVTLGGPGGSGKTRLASEIARSLINDFADGVFFVELASILDADLVLPAIAHILGLQQSASRSSDAQLLDFVRGKRVLLVLDNFEQIVAAAQRLADLHQQAPGLTLLVTSRTLLRLRGEKEVPVPPLPLPEPGECLQQVAQAEAVQLFVARVQDVQPGFRLTEDNAAEVAAICTQLDGLPLALELAAARAKLLTIHALCERLVDPLAFLTRGARDLPDRQQTLHSAIAWSVGLLTPVEQALFRRLAVFRGGFSLEAVATVCNGAGDLGEDVLDSLSVLVEFNLVRPLPSDTANQSRFTLLETIREFAHKQLQASGEADAIYLQHADTFLALAELVDRKWAVSQRASIMELELERDNLRAALAWGLTKANAFDTAARLMWAQIEYWVASGYWSEGRRWCEAALAQTKTADRTVSKAQVLISAGHLTLMMGDDAVALAELKEGLELARELGAKQLIAAALIGLSFIAHAQQETALAVSQLAEAQEISRQLQNNYYIAGTLIHLGTIARDMREYARAQALYEEGLELFQEMGADWDATDSLAYLGLVAQAQGDYERAGALFHESLVRWRALDTLQWKGVADCLEGIAVKCAGEQQVEVAVRLFAAAEMLRQALAGRTPQLSRTPTEGKHSRLRAQLSEVALATAWEVGWRLSTKAAVDLALEQPHLPLTEVCPNLAFLSATY